jgi:hypothetical protein
MIRLGPVAWVVACVVRLVDVLRRGSGVAHIMKRLRLQAAAAQRLPARYVLF